MGLETAISQPLFDLVGIIFVGIFENIESKTIRQRSIDDTAVVSTGRSIRSMGMNCVVSNAKPKQDSSGKSNRRCTLHAGAGFRTVEILGPHFRDFEIIYLNMYPTNYL